MIPTRYYYKCQEIVNENTIAWLGDHTLMYRRGPVEISMET
jgi:hypothetical protein